MMKINDKWVQKYEKLKQYKEEHGNIDVPHFYEKDGIKLSWSQEKNAYILS